MMTYSKLRVTMISISLLFLLSSQVNECTAVDTNRLLGAGGAALNLGGLDQPTTREGNNNRLLGAGGAALNLGGLDQPSSPGDGNRLLGAGGAALNLGGLDQPTTREGNNNRLLGAGGAALNLEGVDQSTTPTPVTNNGPGGAKEVQASE